MKVVRESINEGYSRVGFKRLEEILEAWAEELNLHLAKGKTNRKVNYATKITDKYYILGDIPLMGRDTRLAGTSTDDIDLWVLNPKKLSGGWCFKSGWKDYAGAKEKIKELMAPELEPTKTKSVNRVKKPTRKKS